jgi:hypothetical protein
MKRVKITASYVTDDSSTNLAEDVEHDLRMLIDDSHQHTIIEDVRIEAIDLIEGSAQVSEYPTITTISRDSNRGKTKAKR